MSIDVDLLPPADLMAVADQLSMIYREAFTMPPYEEDPLVAHQFRRSLSQHAKRPGFIIVVARARPAGPPIGFAYGYKCAPGQWWYDVVTDPLPEFQINYWFGDCFELVDLALLPKHHGVGIGSRLHDVLIGSLPHRTVALSTIRAETAALHLYRRRNWIILNPELQFPGIDRLYMLLVKKLSTQSI